MPLLVKHAVKMAVFNSLRNHKGLVLLSFFLAVLMIRIDTGRSDEHVYCVKPEEMENCSDPDCTEDRCYSLMYYANHSNFTTDNTTFRFLAGEHPLLKPIYMKNVANLALISDPATTGEMGNSTVTVKCKYYISFPGGFFFYNITNLKIQGLKIVECSRYSNSFHVYIALQLYFIQNLAMKNVLIYNTTGTGLMMDGLSGSSVIDETIIDSSHAGEHTYGCNLALYCRDYYSEIDNNDGKISTVLINSSYILNGYNDDRTIGSSSGIYIHIACQKKMNITLNRVNATRNRAGAGGNIGIMYISYSSEWLVVISILNSHISYGHAHVGGGLYVNALLSPNSSYINTQNCSCATRDMPILTVYNTSFHENTSPYLGAGVYIKLREAFWFTVGTFSFHNCTFTGSKLNQPGEVGHGGVAVHILIFQLPMYKQHISPLFKAEFTNCNFTQNVVQPNSDTVQQYGTPLSVVSTSRNGVLYIQGMESVTLKNCSFDNNTCTGIVAIHSYLLLYDWNIIHNNTGIRGGGMVLCAESKVQLHNGAILNITENQAAEYGGGIYVESECNQDLPFCFFQVDNVTASSATLNKTKVFLINNTAKLAGSALYGGLIDSCVIFDNITQVYPSKAGSKIFNATFHVVPKSYDISVISSDPILVCFCSNHTFPYDCKYTTIVYPVPGSTFKIHAILLGQRRGLVPGVVEAHLFCKSECRITADQMTQETNGTECSALSYTILSDDDVTLTIQLIAENSYYEYSGYTYKSTQIMVHVQKCPLGSIAQDQTCSCLVGGHKHIKCNIINNVITKQPPVWIGYKEQPNNTTITTDIIFHQFCPLGYCLSGNTTIQTTNESFSQDVQCAKNRSGLLCGKCKTDYSLGFGTSACLRCKHKPLPGLRVVGLIAVCGVAGILLVVLLTLLNLTVSEGTLNGLIFYANIVQVNSDIYFPPESHARPLTAFIAWLNLDFGITTCFYDGMDAYAKTWLQFLFPLYIWLISGAIVYFSWKSNRVARLAGRNAVKVLATLFLLSFGKLLRTIIAAVSYTNVVSHDQTIDISVWLPDASIRYLHRKHITLYVTAVLAGLLTLLYTLTLTFIQCLRKAPENRMFVWVRKLKPLLDAYTGPYKNRYHFWTGLLLLVRILLFVAFAFNLTIGPVLNLSVIILVSTLLMIAIQPGIYRHLFLGLLESSMYVNLILFSTVMIFLIDSYTEYKILAAYLFGGWALVTFLGIVAYHAYRRMFGAPDCGQLRVWCREKLRPRGVAAIQPVIIPRDDSEELESEESEEEREMNATWNTPHLRESLIGSIQR